MTNELKWTSRYGVFRARIGLLDLVVAYIPMNEKVSGYYVSVSGSGSVRITTPFQSVELGKRAAIALAARQARLIIEQLASLDPSQESE